MPGAPAPAPAPPPEPAEAPPPLPTPEPAAPTETKAPARPVVAQAPAEPNPGLVASGQRSSPPPPPMPPRAAGGPVVSAVPKSPVPIPALPREVVTRDADQLSRVCQAVESLAVSLAGVSPDFARGITVAWRRRVGANATAYPIGMYYFIVREAALKHDSAIAAANLAAAYANGLILKFRNLPGVERAL